MTVYYDDIEWCDWTWIPSEETLTAPLRWTRPRAIFVNSMGDLFHESVPDAWIDRVFAVMALAPQHTFILLTKRAKRMREYFEAKFCEPGMEGKRAHIDMLRASRDIAAVASINEVTINWPLPHVILGVSAEDQERADERIPDLLATPAAKRVVSAEPLLGRIDFTRIRAPHDNEDGSWLFDALRTGDVYEQRAEPSFEGRVYYSSGDGPLRETSLDGVIVGGESGPGARPMHPRWATEIRDQCAAAEVAFHFKQWGEWAPTARPTIKGDKTVWPNGAVGKGDVNISGAGREMNRVGKRAAGRLLDGREHNDLPWTRASP